MTATPGNPTTPHDGDVPTVSRSGVSGWALVRVLFLLAVQILMVTTLMTAHSTTPASTTLDNAGSAGPRVSPLAFTRPLAPSAEVSGAGARVSRSGSSMSCAGRSLERGTANATGFNLNVVVGRAPAPGAGQGPLVVTCGDQGQLIILACSPLGGDSTRAPASWNRPTAGGNGWPAGAPAGWDGPDWRGAWQRDWRDQGLSNNQLALLNQLDPDQLRALLAQRYPTDYSNPGYSGGGYGGGPVAGLSLGGMRISVGSPISLNQLPLNTPYGGYGRSNAPAWSDPWASSWYGAVNPGFGPEFGPSSMDGAGGVDDDLDSPRLIASSHRHSHTDRRDDPDEGDNGDGAQDNWGDQGGQRVAVCRWIGQR